MTREEFVKALGLNPEITEDDWTVVTTVYAFHPSISDTHGKPQIASLFKLGGMGLMRDLLHTAEVIEELEGEIQRAREELAEAQAHLENRLKAYRDFKKGYEGKP